MSSLTSWQCAVQAAAPCLHNATTNSSQSMPQFCCKAAEGTQTMMWNGSTAATSVLATVTCTLPGGRDSATHFTYCMQDVASYAGTSTTEDADNGHSHAQAWTCTSAEGMKCSNSWSKCVDSKGKAVESENSTTPGVRARFVVVVLAALVAAMVVA